jgi:pimeloyl-ACP methyl ester carboxylesterase
MTSIDSGGVPIRYETIGEGQPIVLVHGFTLSFDANWRRTGWVDYLVDQGRTVIGLDCRGHGGSGKPRNPAAYAGNRMPDDVLAVMDSLGIERADLMGYSMGGWIALNLLSRVPRRFASVVAGGAGLRPYRQVEAFIEALEADEPARITDPEAREFRTFVEGNPDNDLKALAAVQRADRADADADLLMRVNVPTLVIVGAEDPALEVARRASLTIPTGSLVILPGEDHIGALSAQSCKEAVGDFLNGQALASA